MVGDGEGERRNYRETDWNALLAISNLVFIWFQLGAAQQTHAVHKRRLDYDTATNYGRASAQLETSAQRLSVWSDSGNPPPTPHPTHPFFVCLL